jgi:hypothetical protein
MPSGHSSIIGPVYRRCGVGIVLVLYLPTFSGPHQRIISKKSGSSGQQYNPVSARWSERGMPCGYCAHGIDLGMSTFLSLPDGVV